jgi:hypothetical protein
MTATASPPRITTAGLLARAARCHDPAVTADLVDLARAGDEEAFRQLLEPYRPLEPVPAERTSQRRVSLSRRVTACAQVIVTPCASVR